MNRHAVHSPAPSAGPLRVHFRARAAVRVCGNAGLLTLAAVMAVMAVTAHAAHAAEATGTSPRTPSAADNPTEAIARVLRALDAGDILLADSLFAGIAEPPADRAPSARHRYEIAAARLAASRGDWRKTDETLRSWQRHPARREGSGEVLFWRGWSAMHQARPEEADSLLVLASAYGGDTRSQDALEYRFAGLRENGPALQSYLRGLPESPLPHPLRLASLHQVPPGTALHQDARWQLVLLQEIRGDTARSRPLLDTLAAAPGSLPGRRAAAYRALLKEHHSPDTALAVYETLLMRQQQGVTAEIARQRVRILREKLDPLRPRTPAAARP